MHLQAIRSRNRGVDAVLRALAEAAKSGFTAEILTRRSNRSERADNVFKDPAIDASVLDLEAPWYNSKGQIGCGNHEILSNSLKVLNKNVIAANTDNFAFDFPFAAGKFEANMNALSSQRICFQYTLFGRPGYSTYGDEIAAIIPTLNIQEVLRSKWCINPQLYKALNRGLKTGVPAIEQRFATILDRTLR